MKTALVVGAGKSSLFLIEYLLRGAQDGCYRVIVADTDLTSAEAKIAGHPAGTALFLNATDAAGRMSAVENADVVCSLLPPTLHTLLAHDCLAAGKPLITASYVSEEMRALDADARAKGLLFMCEMGLDPGIDHMSAMEVIARIRREGGRISSFKSYCGGLVAPESDDNPWHYKISWNPRNILLAGKAGAVYKEAGKEVHVEYENLFKDCYGVDVYGAGWLSYYPNRDSLAYPPLYGLEEVPTFIRATLRHPDFCKGWAHIVDLRLTTADEPVPGLAFEHTYADLVLHATNHKIDNVSAEAKANYIEIMARQLPLATAHSVGLLRWLGLMDARPITSPFEGDERRVPELILPLLEEKWAMRPDDKDMVVMQHEFDFTDDAGKEKEITSTLILKGENAERTAMAKTVGLPMGILARTILRGDAGLPVGVCIPTMPEVYGPVLRELKKEGVVFTETEG